jgi:hypothetical protein
VRILTFHIGLVEAKKVYLKSRDGACPKADMPHRDDHGQFAWFVAASITRATAAG